MSVSPWCFNIATDKLEKADDAARAYIAEIERVHSQVDSTEWGQIVAPMNLKANGLETFLTRPNTVYNSEWWNLTNPNCWSEAKDKLSRYDISPQLLQLEAIADGYASYAVLNPVALPLEFISLNIAGRFGRATVELRSFTVARIEAAAYQIYNKADFSVEDAGLQAWFDGTLDVLQQLQTKLSSIKCPIDFKSLYEKAVLGLAQREIRKKEAALEAAKNAEASLKRAERAEGGKAAQAAADLTGLQDEIDALNALQGKIRESIEEEVKEELEEAFADNIAYTQQCILLSFMQDLVDSKKGRDASFGKEFLPYIGANKTTNAPIRMLGEPFGFVNRLVVEPSQRKFFSIPNEVLSSLIPHIRFFKVEANDQGKDVETEITFDSNGRNSVYDSNNVFRPQRGHGVGMKSFNFSYDGTDPFSAKKMIAAKLSIYASTFDELLRERQDPNDRPFKYAELALKTGGVGLDKKSLSEIERENLEKLNFRLKATLGWALPNEKNKFFSKLDNELKNAIYDSFITIYLTPTIHNFSFDETGATTFDIEYLAYIEDAFAQSTYNIFSSLTKEKESREIIFNYFEELGCDIENSTNEQFKNFRKADEQIISDINARAFQKIMDDLQRKNRVYYLNFNKEDIEKLNRDPSDSSVEYPAPSADFAQSLNFADEILSASKIAEGEDKVKIDADEALLSIVAASQENNSIPFFYFGDLIDVVMEQIEFDLSFSAQSITSADYYRKIFNLAKIDRFDRIQIGKRAINEKTKKLTNHLEQFRKMRVILGPMEMFTPLKSDGTILCSIADIPISTSYFFDFMSDRVLSKDIISYPFSKFIKDIINDLISNFLNSDGCTRVDNSQKIKLNSTTVCAYNQNSLGSVKSQYGTCLDDITHAIYTGKRYQKGIPPLTLSGKRGVPSSMLTIDRMMSYFVFTVGRRSPVSNYVGNKAKDESVGIFHYMIGKDNGFVKNITLEKTTATGLKEVRFEQEGYNGLEQLREVYNAKIDTFLNVQTFPGVYVYVEPGGFAPNTTEDLTRFGIGGYCMVTKTEHSIAPGVADTTLHTVWVASKEGDKSKNDKNRALDKPVIRQPEGKEKIKKCLVGPHYLGLLATARGKYSGMGAKERAALADEVIASGAYTMVGWDEGER